MSETVRDKAEPEGARETTLDLLDQLVPPLPSSRRLLFVAASIVCIASLASWAWGGGGGLIIPQPFGVQNRSLQGAVTLAADTESDLVILAGITLPNYQRHDLRVTDVRLDGIPVDVVGARWASENERQGSDYRPFFVIGQHQLPADVPPTDYEERSSVKLDVYLRPHCDAQWPATNAATGSISIRYEYPNRPSWVHNWITGSDPIWAPDQDPSEEGYHSTGLIDDQALGDDDELIPVIDLKSAMCKLAEENQQ